MKMTANCKAATPNPYRVPAGHPKPNVVACRPSPTQFSLVATPMELENDPLNEMEGIHLIVFKEYFCPNKK
jgi:hypothetical protein